MSLIVGLLVTLTIHLLDGGGSSVPAEPSPPPPKEVSGIASWYDHRTGQAAAGPAVRDLLGKNWRGRKVVVIHGDKSITVTLTDWCQCLYRTHEERAIDLDYHDFGKLGDPTLGLLKVQIIPVVEP